MFRWERPAGVSFFFLFSSFFFPVLWMCTSSARLFEITVIIANNGLDAILIIKPYSKTYIAIGN